MKSETLKRAADRISPTYTAHFEYWDDILFSGSTALCFFEVSENGAMTVITDPEKFPRFCTRPYIKRAIESGAVCLGALYHENGGEKWLRFDQISDA